MAQCESVRTSICIELAFELAKSRLVVFLYHNITSQ